MLDPRQLRRRQSFGMECRHTSDKVKNRLPRRDPSRQVNQQGEDELFVLKAAHGIELDFDAIDRLLDRVIDVARRRVP
ncbi:MAG: hypothetical protein LH470_12450 [Lysobacter sp.]|nr:hypothetical protein [Lysobacter sp.]